MILCGRKMCLDVFSWVNKESNSYSPFLVLIPFALRQHGLWCYWKNMELPLSGFIDFNRPSSVVMSSLIAQPNHTGLCAWLKYVKDSLEGS